MNAPPHIDSYRFGSITIDGDIYTRDVIICPEGVIADWWRRDGHGLCLSDLETALEPKPDIIVVGCGASGALRVPEETRRWIEGQGIELLALPTGEACDRYNELAGAGPRRAPRRVVAGLHLTC